MGIEKEGFLHCEGRKILNTKGETVYLRGTNLGGWLVQETWMGAVKGADSHWQIFDILENRFGKEGERSLRKIFEDSFLTCDDLDFLADTGFNCMRLPFWYRNLYESDEAVLDGSAEPDFTRLDWAVEECGKRGMYVILDMHGVPGFQSIAHHCGRMNNCGLYDETPEGERFRAAAAELWRKIAVHYAGNPVVAAYDLMNEPMCDYEGRDKVNRKYWDVYDRMYRAIRAVDPDHIIALEAIWTPLDIPKLSEYGWENVVYEYHLYDGSDAGFSAFVLLEKARRFGNPVLIGEFSPCRGTAKWENILRTFNKAGYHWNTWTYKGRCSHGKSGWFMRGCNMPECVVDLENDSFETIAEKWGDMLNSDKYFIPMNDYEMIGRFASEGREDRI